MAFASQTFSVGQILTAAQMGQVDSNIDAVRIMHKASSAPVDLAAGVRWLDDTASGSWLYQLYDGTDWITLFTVDESANNIKSINLAAGGISTSNTDYFAQILLNEIFT